MHIAVQATLLINIIFLIIPTNIIYADQTSASLDPNLAEAEKCQKIIKVRQDGGGDFKTVTEAVNSVPAGNKVRTILSIGPGVYKEKIKVDRSKPFITFYGEGMPKLTFDGTALKYKGSVYSASVIVESDYFMAANIIFENTAPEPDGKMKDAQAVAMRISGTVDFIFGRGKSFYTNTELHSVGKDSAVIVANAREKDDDDSAYVFVNCKVTGTGKIMLGRTWRDRARVVFAHTDMVANVNPAGWENNNSKLSNEHVFYGEYMNKGPGANTDKRASFAKNLTEEEAKPFIDSKSFIKTETWLLPPPKL
ncbi:Pectinesterase [Thalictrum thalictroides]|uniref:Pectinesterase n=1 Tax=Thalictrum thalictroides TaxID=46969 RepID=A0A7J6X7H7_THATH|nr:Pectinesterase [Thalictrum thalictroides]